MIIREEDEVISATQLQDGHYDARVSHPSGAVYADGPFIRKQGTPDHWCLVATFDQARWVSPDKIDKLEW